MEVFLLIVLVFIYGLTVLTVPARIVRRIWMTAYLAAFAVTGVAVILVSRTGQTVLMRESEFNWYYVLYLFGSMSVILGLVNLWIYKKALWIMYTNKDSQ